LKKNLQDFAPRKSFPENASHDPCHSKFVVEGLIDRGAGYPGGYQQPQYAPQYVQPQQPAPQPAPQPVQEEKQQGKLAAFGKNYGKTFVNATAWYAIPIPTLLCPELFSDPVLNCVYKSCWLGWFSRSLRFGGCFSVALHLGWDRLIVGVVV
jgi:hypothetical protein